MAHPTGTINYSAPGTLRIFLSATYKRANSDIGFPNNSDGNVRIRAYVGVSGSYSKTAIIDKFNQTATIELAYPGGVTWDIGTETVEYFAATGTVQVSMSNIKVAWELVKR